VAASEIDAHHIGERIVAGIFVVARLDFGVVGKLASPESVLAVDDLALPKSACDNIPSLEGRSVRVP
jgi:hypothetical protein